MTKLGSLANIPLSIKKGSLLHAKLKYRDLDVKSSRNITLELSFKITDYSQAKESLGCLAQDIEESIIEKITLIQKQSVLWDHIILITDFLTEKEKRFFIPIISRKGEVQSTQNSASSQSLAKIELITKEDKKNYQVSIKGVSDYYLNKEYIFQDEKDFEAASEIIEQITNLFDRSIYLRNTKATLRYVKVSRDKKIKIPALARIK